MATPAANKIDVADNSTISDEERKSNVESIAKLGEFLRRYAPASATPALDTLQDRFRVELNAPLPEFDTRTARAYAATDLHEQNRQMFALVCQAGTVQRHRAIGALKSIVHRNILTLAAADPVDLSRPEEERFVIFYERPAGKRLSELLASGQVPIGEQFLCERIIAPIAAAINQFSELDIAHGLINPDNIYLGDNTVLGHCVSEPCGYSQPFYCEPIERLQALPAGKGEGTTAQDYYALAVLVLYLLHGQSHFAAFTPNTLARSILHEGVYNAVTRQRDVPEIFYDFFRGILTQNADDRWNYRQLKPWLEGKRYNVLPPPAPIEAIRPFEFDDQQANTRRELAHLFAHGWDHMIMPIQTHHLTQWVSVSLRNKELAENISRISHNVAELGTKNEIQITEQLMRVILILDPQGPIRIKQLSFHIDGIDALCAELYATKANQDLQLLAKFIEFNMGSYWLERQRKTINEYEVPTATNVIFIKLDKLRACIRNGGYGFGLERMLYDLNPDLPCLSPLFANAHVTSLSILLRKLDRLAPSLSKDDPIDRHLAAFIASKIGIQHEIRLHELTAVPALANNRAMLSLHLLSLAQQKSGNMILPGLTHWLALHILPLLDSIHSRSLRKKIKGLLIERAQSGSIKALADLIITSDYAGTDLNGYQQARNVYYHNAAKIENYRHAERIDEESNRVGFIMAKFIAYSALFYSMITLFQEI